VEHRFRLRPGGNQVPKITGHYFCHAWTMEKREDCDDYEVNPAEAKQPAGWDPFGTESQQGTQGPVRSRPRKGKMVEAETRRFDIPATGFTGREKATAEDCQSYAQANSQWNVNAAAAGGVVSGTISAWGTARASLAPRRSKAYAFSMTSIEAQGSTLKKGKITWGKTVKDTVRGSHRSQKDPIDFVVTDLVTGARHDGTLVTISIDMLPSTTDGGFL